MTSPNEDFAEPNDELTATVRVAGEWYEYEEALRRQNRVVVPNQPYFDELLAECVAGLKEWIEPRQVFRARLMPPGQDELPFARSQIGAPPASSAGGGRLNPPGISCLYAALDAETAIAEVRPWINARVTVGAFETVGRVRVVDLSDLESTSRRRAAFAAYMMQRPTHRDDTIAYVATQYLAEHLKSHGADGVIYGSSLRRGGTNAAFFRLDVAKPVATQLWQVGSVIYHSFELTDMKPEHSKSYA